MPYDPAKRRAQYLKTRKLKGRKKGRSPEEKAKLKEQLKAEKEKLMAERDAEKKVINEAMRSFIETVRGYGTGMSSSQKASLKAYIAKAREAYKGEKEKVQAKYKGKYEAAKAKYK